MTTLHVRLGEVRWGQEIARSHAIDGPNERCIEIPLGLAVVQLDQPGWVLDAGCALLPALNAYQGVLVANLVHLTQSIESEVIKPKGTHGSYVSADLRDLRIFQHFDRVVCISTLEHIGGDNTQYGGPAEHCPFTRWDAVNELSRVARGPMFVSVPVHPAGFDCGRWQLFTPDDVDRMAGIFGAEVRYYAQGAQGWYGGVAEPLPFEAAPSSKVQQIACLRT